MKNNFILRNTLGIIYGLVFINGIVVAVSHLLSNGHNIPAMITALLGSFSAFMSSYFLPVPLLKRRFVLGLFLAFIGSFITGLFYSDYMGIDKMYGSQTTIKNLSLSEALKLDKNTYIQLNKTKTKILTSFEGTVYIKQARGSNVYSIYPIVDAGWKKGDTIRMWAMVDQEGGGNSDEKNHRAQFNSANATAIHVSKGYQDYLKSIKAVEKKHSIVSVKDPKIYGFIDIEMENAFWKNRVMLWWLGLNAIWLLFTLPLINAKPKKDANY